MPAYCQNYIGVRTDIVNYNLKSYLGEMSNTTMSYSIFGQAYYNRFISFGGEAGGYNVEFNDNKATNAFVKPTIIFNGQMKHSNIALYAGVSFDFTLSTQIKNLYQYYAPGAAQGDVAGLYEKAYFYKSFGAICGGATYSYEIKRISIGIRYEIMTSESGFYKGYDSNFTRFGLFLKYRINQ